jgi:hypothetical protein
MPDVANAATEIIAADYGPGIARFGCRIRSTSLAWSRSTVRHQYSLQCKHQFEFDTVGALVQAIERLVAEKTGSK